MNDEIGIFRIQDIDILKDDTARIYMVEFGNIIWKGQQSANNWIIKAIEPRWFKFPTGIKTDPVKVFQSYKQKYPKLYDGTLTRYSKLMTDTIEVQLIKYSEVLALKSMKSPYGSQILGFKLIIKYRDQLLIGQRSDLSPHYPGYWSTPGGLIEYSDLNNPLSQALYRELEEETGIELDEEFSVMLIAESQNTKNISIIASLEVKEKPQLSPNEEWLGLGFYSKESFRKHQPEQMTEELNWLLNSGYWLTEEERRKSSG